MEQKFLVPTEEEKVQAEKILQAVNKALDMGDPATAAGVLRDCSLIKRMGLYDMAYELNHETFGCHKNDVLGLVEWLEKALRGEWPLNEDDTEGPKYAF